MKSCHGDTCSNSGLLMPDEHKFCTECGTILTEAKKCLCDEYIGKNDKFCEECGRPTK